MPDKEQNPMPRIALVSAARSGTTHLIRLAETLKDLHVVKNEWLEGIGVAWAQEHELAAFRRINDIDYKDHTDQRLRTWVRANKERTLQILESLAAPADRAVFYKSFPSHVAPPDFDRLFYDRPDTCFVFLTRRPIDSFISLIKAKNIDQWVSADTTAMKAQLDADHYLEWWSYTSDWFTGLKARLNADGKPYGSLTYESDLMPGIEHLLERLVAELNVAGFETRVNRKHLVRSRVKRFVTQMWGGELNGNMGAVKQDKGQDAAAKVSNWSAFTSQIETLTGSLECLEKFMPQEKKVFWDSQSLPPDLRLRVVTDA